MATTALPRHVVFTVPKHGTNTYMHSDTYEYPDDTSAYRDTYVFRQDDGFVFEGKDDIFSEQVKIEIEPSKTDDKCVHLRFSHKNKYWQKNAGDDSIVAVSNKPEEDREKESCTLFEDMSSIDGKIMETDQIDGVFTGVNAYSLKFTVHKYEPLPE
ncbi:hypothetical protein AAHA92_27032 [Salvia divinorum]|uniref:Agglutinin domain-containing protein n=1 Tax=Salvia divinorum TaxID=28513 RepID=A0ABD1G535_SALDI